MLQRCRVFCFERGSYKIICFYKSKYIIYFKLVSRLRHSILVIHKKIQCPVCQKIKKGGT